MQSEEKARRVIQFIECLKHTKGEFHGQPFKLLPWQEQIIRDVFGTVRDEDPSIRQYTTAYIEIPKKQGKSELGAAIALNIKWAEEVFSTFRGSLDSDYPVNCIAQMADNCILISFGEVSEAIAVLIARTSENPNETPELMAYVDMDFNWDVRYDGYISLGEAYEMAYTVCRDKWSSLPEEHIVMGESWFILFDTFGCYDENEGDIPEGFIEPLWVIEIQDQRADPMLECYDPSLSFFTYPVLIDPSNGDVVEIREPERYGPG